MLEIHGFNNKDFNYNPDQQARIKEILEFYETKLPKSNAHQRVLLKVLRGELFREKLHAYAK